MTTLTNHRVFELMQVLIPLTEVEKRPMPLKGGYRIARLKSLLTPDYTVIQEQRREKVKSYDWRPEVVSKNAETGELETKPGNPDDFMIPPDKYQDFNDWWKELGAMEVTIANVKPMPLEQFFMGGDDSAGCLTAAEMAVLGDLLVWNDGEEVAGA